MKSLYYINIQPYSLEPQHISAPFITAVTWSVRESPHFASSFLVSARPGRNFSYLGGISGEIQKALLYITAGCKAALKDNFQTMYTVNSRELYKHEI